MAARKSVPKHGDDSAGSHEFNDAQSCRDRREWLTKELELRETGE
jgi:hypothetical protein